MNEPNQRAVSALPKILAAAAALGVGGRLAVSAGGMAPKSLTDVNASKSVLSMPDVNLLSSAERQRKIEERRIIEQDLSQLLSRNFAAQSKTAAFPYLPELIAGSALTAGGLALANSPKKYEDSVSGRLTNSVRPVYPDAIDGARGELDRAKDIKGTFLGQYAKSLAGVPWFYPAAAIAGSAGLTGGYKLTDAIVKKRAKMKREKALSKARKQFEDILLLEQGLGKKVG
ncbi:MAG: hypothetical protein LBT46_04825, partial [Planctomycetaceae bacterium]|nr:hypothetical protein [Planctomycetaceae bacterium]